jgi:hypothetical protein
VIDSIEKLLQIKINQPAVGFDDVLLAYATQPLQKPQHGLMDRRIASMST